MTTLFKYEKIILQLITNKDLQDFAVEKKKNYNTFEYLAKEETMSEEIYKNWFQYNQIPVIAQFADVSHDRAITKQKCGAILLERKGGKIAHMQFNCMNAMTNSQELINKIVGVQLGEDDGKFQIHYAQSNKAGKLEKFDKKSSETVDIAIKLKDLANGKCNITFNLTQAKSYKDEYHVSIFVSYKIGLKVKIFNVDAYNFPSYVHNYSNNNKICRIVVQNADRNNLQQPGWHNMNCGVYSANIAKVLVDALLAEHDCTKWESIIQSQDTYKKMSNYFDEKGQSKNHTQYHNKLRSQVADLYMKEGFREKFFTVHNI